MSTPVKTQYAVPVNFNERIFVRYWRGPGERHRGFIGKEDSTESKEAAAKKALLDTKITRENRYQLILRHRRTGLIRMTQDRSSITVGKTIKRMLSAMRTGVINRRIVKTISPELFNRITGGSERDYFNGRVDCTEHWDIIDARQITWNLKENPVISQYFNQIADAMYVVAHAPLEVPVELIASPGIIVDPTFKYGYRIIPSCATVMETSIAAKINSRRDEIEKYLSSTERLTGEHLSLRTAIKAEK